MTNLKSSGSRPMDKTFVGVRGWAKFLVGVLAFFVVAGSGLAQQSDLEISLQNQKILDRLSSHVASERIDATLAEFGFPPAGFEQGPSQRYRQWPSLRKLEAAYLSVVEADGPDSGKRFLRSFSRLVATNQTNAIRYEEALQEFFPEPDSTPIKESATKFRFSLVKIPQQESPEIEKMLMTLERYASIPGGMQSLLLACCRLTQHQIYDILRNLRVQPGCYGCVAAQIWSATRASGKNSAYGDSRCGTFQRLEA